MEALTTTCEDFELLRKDTLLFQLTYKLQGINCSGARRSSVIEVHVEWPLILYLVKRSLIRSLWNG